MAKSALAKSVELEQIEFLRQASEQPIGLELSFLSEKEQVRYQRSMYRTRRAYGFEEVSLKGLGTKLWIIRNRNKESADAQG